MSLDVQQVMLGTEIALLRRHFPPIAIKNQILEGIRIAKELSVLEDITIDRLAIDALVAKIDITAQTVGDITISINAATIMAPIDVQGSYIQMPIDIQGAYIMMPVDIQAQYVTLEIDIVAQTVGNINIDIAAQTVGNLAVNIAASAVTMDINIKTQDININIDIEAQSVGIYLRPEWAALQGEDKNFRAVGINQTFSDTVTASYEVPANKTLYITQWSIVGVAQSAGDGDSNQMVEGGLVELAGAGILFEIGGNGGASATFPKPIVINGGYFMQASVTCYGNHDMILEVTVGGYEI